MVGNHILIKMLTINREDSAVIFVMIVRSYLLESVIPFKFVILMVRRKPNRRLSEMTLSTVKERKNKMYKPNPTRP